MVIEVAPLDDVCRAIGVEETGALPVWAPTRDSLMPGAPGLGRAVGTASKGIGTMPSDAIAYG
jgi:hypothetical protein